jgi:septal ring factor EnvC (AmiA/AmiB activator)
MCNRSLFLVDGQYLESGLAATTLSGQLGQARGRIAQLEADQEAHIAECYAKADAILERYIADSNRDETALRERITELETELETLKERIAELEARPNAVIIRRSVRPELVIESDNKETQS